MPQPGNAGGDGGCEPRDCSSRASTLTLFTGRVPRCGKFCNSFYVINGSESGPWVRREFPCFGRGNSGVMLVAAVAGAEPVCCGHRTPGFIEVFQETGESHVPDQTHDTQPSAEGGLPPSHGRCFGQNLPDTQAQPVSLHSSPL